MLHLLDKESCIFGDWSGRAFRKQFSDMIEILVAEPFVRSGNCTVGRPN